MVKYLFVILDKSAPSFCYYRNNQNKPELISLQQLKEIIFFAQKEKMIINFLTGYGSIPEEYLSAISTIKHIFISPDINLLKQPDDILVIDIKDKEISESFNINGAKNIIVRIEKQDIPHLAKIVLNIKGCRRLNIILLDIDKFSNSDLTTYKKELDKINRVFKVNFAKQDRIELSILSDRLMLTKMNNCDAGMIHVTFAPNGKFYICPAFYYNNPDDSIGNIQEGINIKNKQLYDVKYAPICRECDAFQCKRCVYLNRRTTLEVNTPSYQQCVVSHLERNCSRALLKKIKQTVPELSDIYLPRIDYLDPLEKIIDN